MVSQSVDASYVEAICAHSFNGIPTEEVQSPGKPIPSGLKSVPILHIGLITSFPSFHIPKLYWSSFAI